jgi:dTDP-4-dehydrorhamnose 3,5-epimerase
MAKVEKNYSAVLTPYLSEVFYTATAALVIFSLMEIIWPGIVLAYLNLNHVLLFWLIISIITLIIKDEKMSEISGIIIKKLGQYKDERGWLAEIYRDDETDYRPVMCYVSETNPGVVRGPHEHKFQADCFVFAGPGEFELHLWDRRADSPTKGNYLKMPVGKENPILVIVPPGVVHGYKCVSEVPAYSINLPDKLYKGEDKKEEVDEIRWESQADSPYKIE